MDPKEVSSMDQCVAFFSIDLPRILKGTYDGCIEQGFTESQAMSIIFSYVGNLGKTGDLGEQK